MRFLRNPYVVGILAVLAVFLVFLQIFRPQWNRFRARVERGAAKAVETDPKPPTAAEKAAAEKAKEEAKTRSLFAPPPRVEGQDTAGALDRNYVRMKFPEWVDSPARDPFLGSHDAQRASLEPQEPAPVQSWKLTGILRQTGERVAAINGGIYTEGMEIEGWRIERIEADQVVFRGTNRIERLVIFKQFQGVAPGVAPPPTEASAEAPAPPVRKLGRPRPMQEHTVSPEPNL